MIGLEFNIEQNPCMLRFDEIKLRESKGFLELWDIDFSPKRLSKRRRESCFGWINQEYF